MQYHPLQLQFAPLTPTDLQATKGLLVEWWRAQQLQQFGLELKRLGDDKGGGGGCDVMY